MASNESVQTDHSDTLANTDLWVCIDSKGMPKISEIQLAEYVYDALVSNYSEQLVAVNVILGTQYIQPNLAGLYSEACS